MSVKDIELDKNLRKCILLYFIFLVKKVKELKFFDDSTEYIVSQTAFKKTTNPLIFHANFFLLVLKYKMRFYCSCSYLDNNNIHSIEASAFFRMKNVWIM